MDFFEAPYVKRSLEEVSFLRERLINQTRILLESGGQDKEQAIEYLHCLYGTVDREHSLYTRFKLSNDSVALAAASQLDGAKAAANCPEFRSVDEFYRRLKDDIKNTLKQLDDTDLDEPVDMW